MLRILPDEIEVFVMDNGGFKIHNSAFVIHNKKLLDQWNNIINNICQRPIAILGVFLCKNRPKMS